jgi:HEAT repeat protein
LALIHYQGTRLPHRRVDLYRLCVEALAETWNLARSLTGRPIDVRLGERRLDEAFVVRILAPIAYWMHETKPAGLVERDELEAHVAEQFVQYEGTSTEEAAALAHDFLALVREQMGLLVEHAPDAFSFLHLSVQEYLAARFLSERMDGFERLKPRLHHPRWREVVLLTAGSLRGDYATAFIENILNTHGSFDALRRRLSALRKGTLKRTGTLKTLLCVSDLLLAAHCIGDDVLVQFALRQSIRDSLFSLWRHPPFRHLRAEIRRTFVYLKGCAIGPDVLKFLLSVVHDRGEDKNLREATTRALGQVGRGEATVVEVLFGLVYDRSADKWVRGEAVQALADVGRADTQVLQTLLGLLRDRSEDPWVRADAAWALPEVTREDVQVLQFLLSIVHDQSEDSWVRSCAAWVLPEVGGGGTQVLETLLGLVHDRSEDGQVRRGAVSALGWIGWRDAEVLQILLDLVRDRSEDEWVRQGAVSRLGWIGMRDIQALQILLSLVHDHSENTKVRGNAARALAYVRRGETEVLQTLLTLVSDPSEDQEVRQQAIEALGQVGSGETEEIKVLLQAADDFELRDTALVALWNLLPNLQA